MKPPPPRRRVPRALAGLTPLLLLCCRTDADLRPSPNLPVPERFQARATSLEEAAVDGAWWRRFEDPRLDETVQEALRHNRDLHQAAARLERAVATARIAGADLWPQAGLSLDGQRQRQNFIGFPIDGGGSEVVSTTYNRFGLGLNLSWELDLWGRLRQTRRAAREDLEAAQADLVAASQSLAAQTVKSWFALTEARLQDQLADQTSESYRRTQVELDDRVDTGLALPVDARLAAADLAAAEAQAAQRAATAEVLARQLEVLLGRYPDGALRPAEDLPPLPGPVPTGLPADLLTRRPDLGAAERRVRAASARVEAARAALLPRLSLTASGGTASEELSDLLDGDFRIWSLGANLLQPLFEGGRLRAQVDQSEADEAEALAAYAQSALQAFSEVETALAVESPLARQQERLEVAVEASVEALRLAEDRYGEGIDDLLTVLDARRRTLDNQSRLLAVRRARLDARVDLHLALGGAFPAPEREPLVRDGEASPSPPPSPRP